MKEKKEGKCIASKKVVFGDGTCVWRCRAHAYRHRCVGGWLGEGVRLRLGWLMPRWRSDGVGDGRTYGAWEFGEGHGVSLRSPPACWLGKHGLVCPGAYSARMAVRQTETQRESREYLDNWQRHTSHPFSHHVKRGFWVSATADTGLVTYVFRCGELFVEEGKPNGGSLKGTPLSCC